MKVETAAEQLFFVTAHVAGKGTSGSWVGTGFVYEVGTQRGAVHVLVTNKHVLRGAEELTVRMVRTEEGGPALGKGTQITLREFSEGVWVGHPDARVDVAVLPILPVLNEMKAMGAQPYFRSVPAELSLTRVRMAEVDATEEIVFIGYPSGLYDSVNLTPILRRGVTATPINIDYQGLPAFLIDASVFPGSSGSPVFLWDRGIYRSRAGGVVVGSRLMCLGVLAAAHMSQVEGEVNELPARRVAVFGQPLNLGIVYRAETIDTCVDILLARAELWRTEKPGGELPVSDADQQVSDASD